MKRREFLTLLGGVVAPLSLTRPFPATAQRRVPRIGILMTSGPELLGPYRDAFRDLGYVEGQTIEFELREARGRIERLAAMAEELVRSKVDVIVASQTPAAIAAKNATRDIPIVMGAAGDPLATGLVTSLARPEGNVTGLSATSAELAAKNLELIREILPNAHRVGVVGNGTDPFAKPFLEQIRNGARAMRLDIHEVLVRANDEIDRALAAIAKASADAVIIQGSLPPKSTVESALKYRLPAFCNQRSIAEAGALASYSASFAERARGIASYVDKILKGAKPADLPVQQPRVFELVINLKTAKVLGITIPATMLARADEVIE
jgi:putative tryptophan/tyrosine transport system substrate-binding protein